LISVPLLGIPADKSTELFLELDDVIANKEKYENIKLEEIRQLKDRLNSLELNDHLQYFSICDQLHQSYFTFNYDSAMSYALRMIETARQLGMEAKISQAKISLTSTLLASGIFNEAKDTLASFGTTGFNDSLKIEYHYLYSRLYFDMADYYQKSNYIEKYIDLGLHYLDSAIALTDVYTQKYYSLMGLKYVRKHDYTNALSIYEILFGNYNPINRQLAIDASTYGYVLEMNDRLDEGINWLIIAAIEDVKLANKENVALINLANKLFQLGEIEKSSDYLNAALDDAKLYGALQRKFQISQIQPFVEAAKLNITEEQKARIKRYAFIVSLLSLLIVLILLILYRQFQKVKAAKDEINKSNDALKTTNQKLREVNLIKEEYIGHFFKTNSDLIDKLDAYRQKIENKIANHRIDDLQALVNKKSIKEEREEMYRTFDSVFLTIFPDFVPKFNALFQTKNQIILKNTEQLNTDLRIFALIRLGISDTEKIAHVLDYSVNTINTYKTKIKNRSTVSNEAFEQEILNIQSI
jgi:hypothetical protein